MGDIHHHILDNGLILVTERVPGVRSIGMTWLVPAGVGYDPVDRIGVSAVNAELIVRGCADRDARQHADALDALGINTSVTVGTESIRLGATVLGTNLHKALPLLVDMVRRPRFDDSQFEPSRDLALQGLESLKDEPRERVHHNLRRAHHPAPFDRITDGEEAGLRALTLDDCRAHWGTHAVPGGSVLALAGDLEHAAAADRLTELLHDWSGSVDRIAYPTERPLRGITHEADDTDQVHIALAGEGPPEAHDQADLARVLTNVLSGGMGARLFTEVREKRGLVYSVSIRYAPDREFGAFSGYAGTTPERAAQTLDVFTAELARIATPDGLPTDDEVARAKIGLRSRLVLSGESTGARAAALARDMRTRGVPVTLAERAAKIEAVTPDAVRAYAQTEPIRPQTIATIGKVEIGTAAAS